MSFKRGACKKESGFRGPCPLPPFSHFGFYNLKSRFRYWGGCQVLKRFYNWKSVFHWNWFLAFFLMEFSTIRENGKSKSWNKYLSLSLWMSERMFINNSILLASCHWGGSRAEWVRNFYDQTWLATFERACIILSSFFLFHGDTLKRAENKKNQ